MNEYAEIRYKNYVDRLSSNNYYREDNESTNSWVKPFITILWIIVFCLVAIVCFMVGRIWERYEGIDDLLKSQQQKKIEYNNTDYKIFRNYKYSI